MNIFKFLKKNFFKSIDTVANSPSLFSVNPDKDFTRHRIFDLKTVLLSVIYLESGSLKDELLNQFDFSIDTPSVSAFIQARSKVKIDAFLSMFKHFNTLTHKDILYKGYRLLAIDGSVLPISNEFPDSETTILKPNNSNVPFSAFHLNACYDLLEHTYQDLIIQGNAKMNENLAFEMLVKMYKGRRAIFIADRGYESLNSFETVRLSGHKYLIRVKDIKSKTSVLRSFGPFPDGEFDMKVSRILTRKQTKEVKMRKNKYKFVPKNQRFEYFGDDDFYEMGFRVVRFKINEDTYESIITNLDENEFSINEIRELYHLRWEIETSFREIKYDLDLNTLHSKKRDLIKQEIYARLILYNFSERLMRRVEIKEKKRKYEYQLNYVRAFHIIRKYLKEKRQKNLPPIESLIVKEILPVRKNRHDPRKVKTKSAVGFNYRYD